MANSAQVADIRTIRDNLIAIVNAQTAAWSSLGCPPTMSIDGESYDWNNWLSSKLEAISSATDLINKLSGPWIVRSLGR